MIERTATEPAARQAVANSLHLLEQSAYEYLRLNISIFTITGKKPAIPTWKPFQERLPDMGEIQRQLRKRGVTGLAAVLGRVSNDLWAADFDVADVFHEWAGKNPEVAGAVPIVQTARGYHIFGRHPGVHTAKFSWGELRGEGSYVVVPPSLHETGAIYKFLQRNFESLRLLDPETLKLPPLTRRETEVLRYRGTDGIDVVKGRGTICPNIPLALPDKKGQNHERLFVLARVLLEHEAEMLESGLLAQGERLPADLVKAAFQSWYQQAKPFLRDDQSLDEYFLEFLEAWADVKVPIGDSSIKSAWEAATLVHPPKIATANFSDRRILLLCALCRELQRRAGPDKPFFLAVRTAQELLMLGSTKTTHTFLRGIEALGIIRAVERGRADTRKATRYKYLGPLNDEEGMEDGVL